MSGKFDDFDSYEEPGGVESPSEYYSYDTTQREVPRKSSNRGRGGGNRTPRSKPKDDFIDDGSDSFDTPKPTRGRGRATKRQRAVGEMDDDVDSTDESPAKLSRRGRGARGRPRGSVARGRGTVRGGSVGRGVSAGRPRGRARGASTRGRGARKEFLDDDDFVVGEDGADTMRRSSRNLGKKKDYTQLRDEDDDGDSFEPADSTNEMEEVGEGETRGEEEAMEEEELVTSALTGSLPKEKVLEKILAHRVKENSDPPVHEFFVKWKFLSYIHAEWVPQAFIEASRMGGSRLKKFLSKETPLDPDELFDPNFVEVDRICAKREIDGVIHYFVKWGGLPYCEGSWEKGTDINDDAQIKLYEEREARKDTELMEIPPHPEASEFQVLGASPQYKNDNTLRSYQLEGLNWLRFNWYNNANCILADEMGLGKTVQSMSFIYYLYKQRNIRGPFLIIVPLSTISHWQREFERWTEMNLILYHGNATSRELLRQFEWYFEDGKGGHDTKGPFKFNVVVTTYEMVILEKSTFRSIDWEVCIIDEAHRLKNKESKLTTELGNLTYKFIVLLTGTPVQNNTEELWTLLNIIDSKKFSSFAKFSEDFSQLKDAAQVEKLQALLRPYLLRRMKEDVESLAPKEETIIEVELTQLQKKYYRAILEKNFQHLVKGNKVGSVPSLMNVMMQLRKCCNHPFLLRGVEDFEMDDKPQTSENVHSNLIEASGKLVLIDKLLPKLLADKHRVLIFSQMVRILDILEDYLYFKQIKHERIDGSVRGNDRQLAIDRFCSPDSDTYVFLLCTRAGGIGINLTAADTVIIYDSDWNPQNDIQAQARCHRIGQEKKVKIYRLITRNTYERQMFDRASKKLGLDRAILNASSLRDSGNGATEMASMQKNQPSGRDVDALLRNGAYGLFNDDDDESRSFCEADIDKILEARTQTVVHDQTGNSSFAKASFASSSARPELDVNDPDFWTKLLPERSNRPDPKILNLPRQRKAIQRFSLEDVEDSDLELSGDGQGEDGDLYEEEEVMGDDEYEPPSEATKENQQKVFFVGWSQVARNRMQKGILLFGYGRWRKIRNVEKIRRPELVMELYGRAYLRKLCAALTLELDEALQQLDNSDENELEDEKDSKLAAAKAKQEAPAQETLPNQVRVEEMDIEPEIKPEATATTTTTTDAASVDVRAEEMKAEDQVEEMKIEEPISAPEPEADYVKLYDAVYDEDRALNEPSFLAKLKQTSKTIYKRLKLLSMLGDLVRSDFRGITEENWPVAAGSGPGSSEYPDWWTAKHDKDLLVGTYKHGFGRYERMRADPELCFCGNVRISEAMKMKKKPGRKPGKAKAEVEAPAPPPTEEEGSFDLPLWPSAKYLTHRVKYALDQLTGTLGPASGMKTVPFPKRGNAGKERTQKLRNDWSKREMTDFYRVISSYGIPFKRPSPTTGGKTKAEEPLEDEKDYVFIKEQAKLTQKTLDMIKQYSEDFITQCQELLGDATADKNTKNKTSGLTYIQAKRALERITLFDELRKHVIPLSDKAMGDKFALLTDGIIVSQAGLPSWWVPVIHDCALIRGVTHYGFCKWDLIMGDARLPFKAAIEAHIEKEERSKAEAERKLKEKADAEAAAKAQRQQIIEQYQTTTLNPQLPAMSPMFQQFQNQLVYLPVPTSTQPAPQQPQEQLQAKQKPQQEAQELPKKEAEQKDEKQDDAEEEEEDADMGDDEDHDEFKATTKKTPKKGKKGKRGGKKPAILAAVPRDKILFKRLNVLVNVAKSEQPLTTNEVLSIDDNILFFLGNLKRKDGSTTETTTVSGKPGKRSKKVDVKHDEEGKIIYPINVCGVLSIHNLGIIDEAPAFHNDKYIWPVGFKSRREYISIRDPSKRGNYICEILKDKDQPVFRITPEDDPENLVEAKSATQAWNKILEKISGAAHKAKKGSVSGPDYFGFGIDGVSELISKLPGAQNCNKLKGKAQFSPPLASSGGHPAATHFSPTSQRVFSSGLPAYLYGHHSPYFSLGMGLPGGLPGGPAGLSGIPGGIPGSVPPTNPVVSQLHIPGTTPAPTTSLFYPQAQGMYAQWQAQMLRQQQQLQQQQLQQQPQTQPPTHIQQRPQTQPTQSAQGQSEGSN